MFSIYFDLKQGFKSGEFAVRALAYGGLGFGVRDRVFGLMGLGFEIRDWVFRIKGVRGLG